MQKLNHRQELVKYAAQVIQKHGFKVMIAASGEHGYFTDETGARVCSFQYDLSGEIIFSGNYKSKSNGTGWHLCGALPENLTKEGLNGMLYANSQFEFIIYTTEKEHLARYGKSSDYAPL